MSTDIRGVRLSSGLRAAAALIAIGALAVGCAPDGEGEPSGTMTPSPSATASSSPSATPTPSATPRTAIELPAQCEDIYSAAMLSTLTTANPPLNDPGVDMVSTELVEGLEAIESGIPTIRCSWGAPSDYGLATNVTVIDAAAAETVKAAATERGYFCTDELGGTACRTGQDFAEGTVGEELFFRDNALISTHWINFAPEGYTADIVATLWG